MPRVVSNKRRSSVAPKEPKRILTVYDVYPDYIITLNDFEELGKRRFLLLKWIEHRRIQGKPLDDLEAKFLQVPVEKPTLFDKIRELNFHISKDDSISHFVLRLACSSTEERSKWFVQYETVLFERRYLFANSTGKTLIHARLKISSDILSKDAFLSKYNDLNGKHPLPFFSPDSEASREKESLPLHRVPFHEVCELVGRRAVVIHRGFAFVPHGKFHTVVRGRFRRRLNVSLHQMKRENTLNRMREDESASRLVPLLENILKGLENSYRKSKLMNGEVRAKDLRKLKKHMPLCMSQIMTEDCEKNKYARHWGILHLSLFLKGIGLPITEAQRFWRASCKEEKKYKEVSGNLRHMYGLSGARRDYTPFGCYKLVDSVKNSKPEKGCHFGCPFAFYTNARMVPVLRSRGLAQADIEEVLELKKGTHFGMACRKVFESTHRDLLTKEGLSIDDINSNWDHPNRYFDNSYHLHNPQKITELAPDSTQDGEAASQKPFIRPNFTPIRLRNTPKEKLEPVKKWTPQFQKTPKVLKTTPTFGKRTPTFGKKHVKTTPKFGSASKRKAEKPEEEPEKLSLLTQEDGGGEVKKAQNAMDVEDDEQSRAKEEKPAAMEIEHEVTEAVESKV